MKAQNQPIIYLDYAAATPLDPAVKAAMDDAERLFANPSARYAAARTASDELTRARARVAKQLGCTAAEIVFTSGGTEADNLAIFGLAEANAEHGRHIISVQTEHKAVLEPLATLQSQGWEVDFAPVDSTGRLQLDKLQKLIRDDTILIAISLASSETGTLQPVREVAKIVAQTRTERQRRGVATPLYLHSDGSAAAGQLNLQISRVGVDTLSLNAAKIYGPKGSGALYIRRGTSIAPQIVGGGQENGLRAGTENVAGAVGLATALELANQRRMAESERLKNLRDQLQAGIIQLYPTARINGSLKYRLPNILNVSLPGLDGEDVVAYFDAAGIAVATGAACTAGSGEPNRALLAMGLPPELAQSSLRLSLGRATTDADIKQFLTAFQTITAKLATIQT